MDLQTVPIPQRSRLFKSSALAADAAGRVACVPTPRRDNVLRETALSGVGVSAAREFFNSKRGRYVAIGLACIAVLFVAWSLMSAFRGNEIGLASRERIFIDSQTGKSFKSEIKSGMTIPVQAPSGGSTGYPAEFCYWTADGKSKADPTPVLLNTYIGKTGPTFCPDCGRLVVGHNPAPSEGVKPPPTQAEYKPRRSSNEN